MKSKWYFGTLLFILALLGFSQPQVSIPNQEIVLQFSDDEVTVDEAQKAIAIVKEQLRLIGANKIQVSESADGSLKITYYSDIDVAIIEGIFSARVPLEALAEAQEKSLDLGYTSYYEGEEPTEFPSEKDSNTYKLNVSEIHSGSDAQSDFNGLLVELTENERLFNPVVFFSIDAIDGERNRVEKTTYTVQRNIALAIESPKYKIPEVRAGPTSNGIS